MRPPLLAEFEAHQAKGVEKGYTLLVGWPSPHRGFFCKVGAGEDFVLAGTHLTPPSSCLQYSWFFFEILVKSMALYLLDENKIKVRVEAHPGEALTDKPRGSCGNARSLS